MSLEERMKEKADLHNQLGNKGYNCIPLRDAIRIAKEYAEEIMNCVPTNWVDSLLTGENAALPKGYSYTPKDIENLLRELKNRMRNKLVEAQNGK